MIVAGLTGGLASGKSTVARLFQECGAVLLDADVLARRVVEPGKPAWRDLLRAFGPSVLRPDRTLDRPALARIVFRNRAKLRTLNTIVHPRVTREQARLTREIAQKDRQAVIIYDAALLIEAGAHCRMDRIIVVTADRETQITRLQKRNGFSRPEAVRRIRSQMPLPDKLGYADYVLDGMQPIGRLRSAVRAIYADLQRQSKGTAGRLTRRASGPIYHKTRAARHAKPYS